MHAWSGCSAPLNPAEFLQRRQRGDNRGTALINDVDHIKTHNSSERARVIQIFRANGVEEFPDGRTLQEVIL
jgi:hypothetical protein